MLTNSVYQEEHIPNQRERFWMHFRNNNVAMFGLWVLILLTVIMIFSPWLTPYDPYLQSGERLMPPSWLVCTATTKAWGQADKKIHFSQKQSRGPHVTIQRFLSRLCPIAIQGLADGLTIYQSALRS